MRTSSFKFKSVLCSAFALLSLTFSVSAYSGTKILRVADLTPGVSGQPSGSGQTSTGARGSSTGCAVATATSLRSAGILEELQLLNTTMSKTSSAIFSYLKNEDAMFGVFDIEGAYKKSSGAVSYNPPPTFEHQSKPPVSLVKFGNDAAPGSCSSAVLRY